MWLANAALVIPQSLRLRMAGIFIVIMPHLMDLREWAAERLPRVLLPAPQGLDTGRPINHALT